MHALVRGWSTCTIMDICRIPLITLGRTTLLGQITFIERLVSFRHGDMCTSDRWNEAFGDNARVEPPLSDTSSCTFYNKSHPCAPPLDVSQEDPDWRRSFACSCTERIHKVSHCTTRVGTVQLIPLHRPKLQTPMPLPEHMIK